MRPRLDAILPLALALVATAPLRAADEGENRKRLEAMPRERRVHLAGVLDRFDALPAGERSAVRELDAGLAGLDPEVQARYRLLLRRYHVWVEGLDDAQKKQLASAGSVEAKLALVTKWRNAEREADTRTQKRLIFGVPPADLGTIPPFEMANALRVWRTLDAKERARVEKIDKIPARLQELVRIGRHNGVRGNPFPEAVEDALLDQLEADENVKTSFPKNLSRLEKSSDPDAVRKRRAEARKAPIRNPIHHLAESLYFLQHPPEPVSKAHLEQFEAEIPGWLRVFLDPLPPEDARRRLTILYRQVFPAGQEIPPPSAEGPEKSKAPAKPAAPAPPPGNSF